MTNKVEGIDDMSEESTDPVHRIKEIDKFLLLIISEYSLHYPYRSSMIYQDFQRKLMTIPKNIRKFYRSSQSALSSRISRLVKYGFLNRTSDKGFELTPISNELVHLPEAPYYTTPSLPITEKPMQLSPSEQTTPPSTEFTSPQISSQASPKLFTPSSVFHQAENVSIENWSECWGEIFRNVQDILEPHFQHILSPSNMKEFFFLDTIKHNERKINSLLTNYIKPKMKPKIKVILVQLQKTLRETLEDLIKIRVERAKKEGKTIKAVKVNNDAWIESILRELRFFLDEFTYRSFE